MDNGVRGSITRDEQVVHNVPGIGPARVRAFHARGTDFFGERSGVFLGPADVGTTVHELVHARLSEMEVNYPLWLEEGLASLLGDGAYFEGEWHVDGLACWPHRRALGRESQRRTAPAARLPETRRRTRLPHQRARALPRLGHRLRPLS